MSKDHLNIIACLICANFVSRVRVKYTSYVNHVEIFSEFFAM